MASLFSDVSAIENARAALAIFCRAPALGRVKTRLARTRGDQFALELYRAMLQDTLETARVLAPAVESLVCYTPAEAFAPGSELSALWDGAHVPQSEGDLGARMLDCLADLRARGYGRVAVVGSDAPDLPPDSLRGALALLGAFDVVVGPSFDGGFYFLGACCDLPDAVFAGIEWSRDTVFERLVENLKSCGLSHQTLATWRDVDEAADLEALCERLRNGETRAPATFELLNF